MNSQESILVTGGAGFIGSHLCESLLENGFKVICADNFDDYYNPEFKEENIKKCLSNKNFKLYRADITDFGQVNDIFHKNKIDRIAHLAAKAGVRASIDNPQAYEEVNVKGTLNLLILSKQFKIKNFVFGSSSSVYGNSDKIPFSEDAKTDSPISPYAATKKSAELLCYTFSYLHGLNVTCLRLFTVYGPRGRPDMAPYKFTDLIYHEKEVPVYGNGKSKRDYTFVADIVAGITSALKKEFKFEIINLGNSSPVELNLLISLIEENIGKKAKIKRLPLQPGEVAITYSDISKAKKLLNWQPKVRINQGIKELVNWYKNERA